MADPEDAAAVNLPRGTAVDLPRGKKARAEVSTLRLLHAAGQLIAEGGYERTTLAAIGKRAGYSHGLVTRRFGSKEGLLWALVERMTIQYGADTLRPAIGERVGADALQVVVDGIRSAIRRRPEEMRTLFALMFEALKPLPLLQDRMVAYHEGFRRNMAGDIERGVEQGAVRSDVDAAVAAALFVGSVRGAAYQWLLDPAFDVDRVLAALGDQVEVTLRPGPRAAHAAVVDARSGDPAEASGSGP